MTPNQRDFYPDEYMGTMNRPGSEHHYHYAQLSGGPGNPMCTFYGNQVDLYNRIVHQIAFQFQDDPSPYATTTLIMSNQQPTWLSDRSLRGPVVPTNPIPNGPPPRFAEQTHTGRRSRGSRTSDLPGSQHSDSPPHTDVSYVQVDINSERITFLVSIFGRYRKQC